MLILIVKDELIEFCLMIRKFMLPTDQQLELDHWAETGDFNVTELHEVLVYILHMWKHHQHHHQHQHHPSSIIIIIIIIINAVLLTEFVQ